MKKIPPKLQPMKVGMDHLNLIKSCTVSAQACEISVSASCLTKTKDPTVVGLSEGVFIRVDSWPMMLKAGNGLAGAQAVHTA